MTRDFCNQPQFISIRGHNPHLLSFPTRRSSDLKSRFGQAVESKDGADHHPKPPFRAEEELVQRGACCRPRDRKSTRLNSSHLGISYAVFCLKNKKRQQRAQQRCAMTQRSTTNER